MKEKNILEHHRRVRCWTHPHLSGRKQSKILSNPQIPLIPNLLNRKKLAKGWPSESILQSRHVAPAIPEGKQDSVPPA